MTKKRKIVFIVLIILIIVFSIFYIIINEVGAGLTKSDTARILVKDRKFGNRAALQAIKYGDGILYALKKESEDYKLLDNRNSFWIAEVLGSIKTDSSRIILNDLLCREDTLSRLVGAIGLAQQGYLIENTYNDTFLFHIVNTMPEQTETQLAIIALGKIKGEKAKECLINLLKKNPPDYWHNAYACEALASIGSKDAIPVLQNCLRDSNFHALPEAFRTLITLGDIDAVPLAIKRITPAIKNYNSGFIVDELAFVTGVNFSFERSKWEYWWETVKNNWQIPDKFLKPFEEQPSRYGNKK